MSKRSRACDISPKVRRTVEERDGGRCVVCGRCGIPNAHYLPRSAGGLGVAENIVTLCHVCHHDYDNGAMRKAYGAMIKRYLEIRYPGWDESKLIYRKYDYGIGT